MDVSNPLWDRGAEIYRRINTLVSSPGYPRWDRGGVEVCIRLNASNRDALLFFCGCHGPVVEDPGTQVTVMGVPILVSSLTAPW